MKNEKETISAKASAKAENTKSTKTYSRDEVDKFSRADITAAIAFLSIIQNDEEVILLIQDKIWAGMRDENKKIE